jgi:hypothetical protein
MAKFHLSLKLAIVTLGDLQWDDADTEKVSTSKQVISGDRATDTESEVQQRTRSARQQVARSFTSQLSIFEGVQFPRSNVDVTYR